MNTDNFTIDSIIDADIRICQLRSGGFRFGTDSVVLAYFSKPKKHSRVLEIGAGSGIISILIAKFYGVTVDALELQEPIYETLKKSIELSNLEDKINPILGDIKDFKVNSKKLGYYNHIISNPPYRCVGTGKIAKNSIDAISRFNLKMDLEDILIFCRSYLTDGGHLTLSYDADRMIDLIYMLRSYHLEPKRLQLIYPSIDKSPKIVIIDAVKSAGVELKISKPIVQSGDNIICKEYNKIFNCKW